MSDFGIRIVERLETLRSSKSCRIPDGMCYRVAPPARFAHDLPPGGTRGTSTDRFPDLCLISLPTR